MYLIMATIRLVTIGKAMPVISFHNKH
jgi:hypothetical protein